MINFFVSADELSCDLQAVLLFLLEFLNQYLILILANRYSQLLGIHPLDFFVNQFKKFIALGGHVVLLVRKWTV